MSHMWLVTVPDKQGEGPDSTARIITDTVEAQGSKAYRFNLPDGLSLGTLDILIALSDEMTKINSLVEVCARPSCASDKRRPKKICVRSDCRSCQPQNNTSYLVFHILS
jgi:V-ATPase subunit C